MVAMLCAPLLSSTVTAQATRDDKLPSAEALLQKMVKAMGGEAALRKNKFQKLTGTFELPSQGVSAPMVVYTAAPNLNTARITVAGFGEFASGYDGEIAWRDNPQSGPTVLDGIQEEQAIQQADYYATLNYQKTFETIEVVGRKEFGENDCYELKLTTKSGSEQALFINAETYRIAGNIRMVSTALGDLEAITTIEEYKEFDGQQIGIVTRGDIGGGQQVQIVTISDVSFEPFDKEVFNLPDSIQKLVDEASATSQPDSDSDD